MAKSRKEIEAEILAQASTDEAFRKELLSDPKSALEKKLQMNLPGNLKVTALEESADQAYVVVPVNVEQGSSRELSESQLASVAGGVCWSEECSCNP